uniref:Uncharacterized protein n=1 Tax=Oryza barthii TaxID=65489 RepID=A0A0D3H9E8_9ORYZ
MATPICPRLFITASPVPTPIRNDANMSQKSSDMSACAIVCSSPSTGFSPGPRASAAAAAAVAFATRSGADAADSASSTSAFANFRVFIQDFHATCAGTAAGDARSTRSTATKTADTTPPPPPTPVRSAARRYSAMATASVLIAAKHRPSSSSSRPSAPPPASPSRRNTMATAHTAAGTTASMTRNEAGSSANSAEQTSVKIATRHRAPAPAEVADAGDEHGGVHPRRAVPAEAEEDAHLPVGQRRDGPGHDEPLRAVAEEALEGADGEEEPGGDAVGGEAGEEAERLADVLGDGEAVELQLGEAHERLDGVGLLPEMHCTHTAVTSPSHLPHLVPAIASSAAATIAQARCSSEWLLLLWLGRVRGRGMGGRREAGAARRVPFPATAGAASATQLGRKGGDEEGW